MAGIPHLQDGRKFAERFISTLLSWGSSGRTISATMHIGVLDSLTVFRFTCDRPPTFAQTVDQSAVSKYVERAKEIAPTCDPKAGGLAVFDGKDILMFRRFDENLTRSAPLRAAREVAGAILMNKPR